MDKLEFSITSEIGNIVKVENFIDYFVDVYHVEPEVFGKISLCVIEAVNNAILYGNKLDPSKYVKFFVREDDGKLCVTVKDEGDGFDYNYIPDPTLPDNIEKDAGRGLYLMKTLSDDLIFEDNGSKVTLVFNL
ncbi:MULTISPECIES: ATP-binding protein [Porphyromonadaceae]|uniref:ATP-binding protein n=1 Tax=Sanguibacteroides justesenii TaxID=1547597 RepID=A0A0C3R4T1_9PORP|nr:MULTISPECIES: ATP-binding protein [Porphyromonadaceae]KIO44510.1 ATP-binding protein [Sanguibacteroides justesenii]KIO45233.1 ATP-binding protein [Sanguibacteroides justesenii]PXZ44523.1 ATP-binding protein [Sanguibacteroides justesenii]